MSYNNYVRPENKYKITNEYDFLNEEYENKSFEQTKEELKKACEYWKSYPDIFIDMIKPPNCKIDLFFYQRLMLRILLRYRKIFFTFTRGTAKSFTQILAMYLKCIFYPGTHQFICAPKKMQAAEISQENIEKIWEYYPILKKEIKTYYFHKDYTKLIFTNGSKIDVVQSRDSQRGGRKPLLRPLPVMAS